MSGEYEKAFRESVSDPERFWGELQKTSSGTIPLTGSFRVIIHRFTAGLKAVSSTPVTMPLTIMQRMVVAIVLH